MTPEELRDLAAEHGACVRPLVTLLTDTVTGEQSHVPIPCGSTRESKCPTCAAKARRLRMQQCREGWHLTDEPDTHDDTDDEEPADLDEVQHLSDDSTLDVDDTTDPEDDGGRRVRSTRRRQDVAALPRVPMEARTVGRAFTTPQGKTYRPSMFVTLTLDSYGPVTREGTPADPSRYDYRRAALDAMHFAKVVDRFFQNLRRCAGYKVQYFAAVEPQRRLAPHLHAGIRGAIPRALLKQVAAATYHQVWWPAHDLPVYVNTVPVWDPRCSSYVDPVDGVPLRTWDEALDDLGDDPDAEPAHVVRLGSQVDVQGILAESGEADKRVGYLCKYLTKSISETYGEDATPAQRRHLDRLHDEVRWLPCSPACSNWLRYGVQPKNPTDGMTPGECPKRAHDRENLGLGGRRVLVSRQWTGKTLTEHKADRATVVREVLAAAGVDMAEVDRCSATALRDDGEPRFVWERLDPTDEDLFTRRHALLASIRERMRWRAQYDAAKRAGPSPDIHSAIPQAS